MTTSDDIPEHVGMKAAMKALQAELDLLKGRPNAEFDLLMAEIETFGRPGRTQNTPQMIAELTHAILRLKRYGGQLPAPVPSRMGLGLGVSRR